MHTERRFVIAFRNLSHAAAIIIHEIFHALEHSEETRSVIREEARKTPLDIRGREQLVKEIMAACAAVTLGPSNLATAEVRTLHIHTS